MNLIATATNLTYGTVMGHCHSSLSVSIFQNKSVLINGFPILVDQDQFITSVCTLDPHPPSGINYCTIGPANMGTVLINQYPVIITGDLVSCGDTVGLGSNTTVFAY